MHYGFCATTLIPCRAEASDKVEQVNQLLFGETYKILGETEKWLYIETLADQYQGWIDIKLHSPLNDQELAIFQKQAKQIVTDTLFPILNEQEGTTVLLTVGAILPKVASDHFMIGAFQFKKLGHFSEPQKDLLNLAKQFINAPYLWGGKTIFGVDCSGFTQVIFRAIGVDLPRDAYQQVQLGTPVNLEEVNFGDLAFFGKPEGKITHVGLCIDQHTIIHSSGKCRIDTLDNAGILNNENRQHTHQLRIIKRL